MPVDVFQHHDAVVQRHADGKGDPGQRDHIDGAPADEQAQEGREGADGNAQGADEGGGWRPEEQVQHEGGEQGAEDQIIAHVAHGVGDVLDVIEVVLHAHTPLLQQSVVQFPDLVYDPVPDFHHVGADLPAYPQAHGLYPMRVEVGVNLERGQFDIAQVAQTHERAVTAGDHHVFHVRGGLKAPNGPEQVTALAAIKIAAGHIPVAGADGVAHLGQRDPAFDQLYRVHVYLDLPLRPAVHGDFRDAPDPLKLHAHVIFQEIAHFHHVDALRIARQGLRGEEHERVLRGVGDETGFIDVFRVAGDLGQGIVYPDQYLVDVGAVRELQLDLAQAGHGSGDHAVQTRNPAQVFLLFDDDLLFHVLGRGAGPLGYHGHHPHVEIRDHLYGHAKNGKDAEQADDQHRHRDDQRLLYGKPEHV